MTLEIGDTAPNFELPDTELKMRTLDEFKGKKTVLSFIVAASSPVCEVELCTFRDSWQEIQSLVKSRSLVIPKEHFPKHKGKLPLHQI